MHQVHSLPVLEIKSQRCFENSRRQLVLQPMDECILQSVDIHSSHLLKDHVGLPMFRPALSWSFFLQSNNFNLFKYIYPI